MRRAALLPLLLLVPLAPSARGEDIQFDVERGLAIDALIERFHERTGIDVLYAPGDTADRTVDARIGVSLDAAHAPAVLALALATAGLEIAPLAGGSAAILVKPARALADTFRLAGDPTPLVFDRVPASWVSPADRGGSLGPDSVAKLLERLAAGEPAARARAAFVLGLFGPRDEETAGALAAALDPAAPEVLSAAATALGRLGHFAKSALPALETAAAGPGPGGEVARRAAAAVRDAVHPLLLAPASAKERAPATYTILFETTKGEIEVEVDRSLAPVGADRLYNLVRIGFFDDTAFFRVAPGFVAQFGMHGRSDVNAAWRGATLEDEPVKTSNKRGTLTFATSGTNQRSTQLFFNLKDNTHLDALGFAPVGRITRGQDLLSKLSDGYGEKPDQGKIFFEGNAYLAHDFPKLDYIRKARIR
jgi:peptidyl-prolyl cis-trans isomerase A (cyclophilin A)